MAEAPRRPITLLLLQIAWIILFLLTAACIAIWIIAYKVLDGLGCGHLNSNRHCSTTSPMDLNTGDFMLLIVAPGVITGTVFILALIFFTIWKKRHARWQRTQNVG